MVRNKIAVKNIFHRVLFNGPSRQMDVETFFNRNVGVIHQTAFVIFKKFKKVMRMQLILNVSLKKQDENEMIFCEPFFATKYEVVIGSMKIRKVLLEGFLKIIQLFENFIQGGSGWTLNKILTLELKLIIIDNSVKCL